MNELQRQKGMTYWGWLVILAILGVAVLVGVKLTPKYLDYFAVKRILDQVAEQEFAGTPNARDVWSSISKHLNVNYIEYIKPEHLNVKKEKDGVHMTLEYEVREPILGNVDAVLSFNHTAVKTK